MSSSDIRIDADVRQSNLDQTNVTEMESYGKWSVQWIPKLLKSKVFVFITKLLYVELNGKCELAMQWVICHKVKQRVGTNENIFTHTYIGYVIYHSTTKPKWHSLGHHTLCVPGLDNTCFRQYVDPSNFWRDIKRELLWKKQYKECLCRFGTISIQIYIKSCRGLKRVKLIYHSNYPSLQWSMN